MSYRFSLRSSAVWYEDKVGDNRQSDFLTISSDLFIFLSIGWGMANRSNKACESSWPSDMTQASWEEGGLEMLDVVGLEKRFSNRRFAFRELSFHIPRGAIVGILGTSGCGKSTILRILSGLDQATAGQVLLDSTPIQGIDPRINLVFQEPRLLPWRTIWDNVAFGLPKNLNKEEAQQRIRNALETVGLLTQRQLLPKHLSGGMAQRTALARALVRTPEVLLLDEPFSALDAFIRMQLQEVILDIHRRNTMTIVLVTHDIDEALYLCDSLLILRGQPGRLVGQLRVEEPRPRHRGSPWLARQKEHILQLLDLGQEPLEVYVQGGGI